MINGSNTDVLIYVDDTPGNLDPGMFSQQPASANIIITSTGGKLFYPNHRGVLSVKSVFKGAVLYVTDSSRYTVGPENYLVLNEGTEYSCHIDSVTDTESFAIHFSPHFVAEVYKGLSLEAGTLLQKDIKASSFPELIEKTYHQDHLISPAVLSIRSLAADFNTNKNEIIECFHVLLRNLLELNESTLREIGNINVAKYATKVELYKRLCFAKDYIDSCYSQDISLETIARVACMNSEYFIRQFKRRYHVTPIQYLIRKRMKVAKALFNSPGISVTEVCQGVGYSDISSFGKLFKRFYGVSPRMQ